MSNTSVFARIAADTSFHRYDQTTWEADLKDAVGHNDVDALSLLISLPSVLDANARIEAMAVELLQLAMPQDGADAALYLLNYLEELRRIRQRQWVESGRAEEEARVEAPSASEAEQTVPQAFKTASKREGYVLARERHCCQPRFIARLLSLAREAHEVHDAARCVRVLLLHAHRLRKTPPQIGQPLCDFHNAVLVDLEGRGCLPWPDTPADLPRELTQGGFGGCDLSLGGEAVPLQVPAHMPTHMPTHMPIRNATYARTRTCTNAAYACTQWINEVDATVPPPIVFVRRCIDVDVRPDWTRLAGACSTKQQEVRGGAATMCSHMHKRAFPGYDGSGCARPFSPTLSPS